MTDTTRRCPRCEQPKAREEFGTRPYCASCFAAYLRGRRALARPLIACAHCGLLFPRKSGGQITCSAVCGKLHTRGLRGFDAPGMRTCIQCGSPFVGRANARHCSAKCRAATSRHGKRARAREIPGHLIAEKMAFWGNACWMCRGPFEHVDHVKPLSKGGPHLLANLRPACASCNTSKHAKWDGPQSLARFVTA